MIASVASACIALLAGVLQVHSLARAATHRARPFPYAIRMLGVAGILLVAALAGAIVPAALGWLTGFAVSVVWLWVRWRP